MEKLTSSNITTIHYSLVIAALISISVVIFNTSANQKFPIEEVTWNDDTWIKIESTHPDKYAYLQVGTNSDGIDIVELNFFTKESGKEISKGSVSLYLLEVQKTLDYKENPTSEDLVSISTGNSSKMFVYFAPPLFMENNQNNLPHGSLHFLHVTSQKNPSGRTYAGINWILIIDAGAAQAAITKETIK